MRDRSGYRDDKAGVRLEAAAGGGDALARLLARASASNRLPS